MPNATTRVLMSVIVATLVAATPVAAQNPPPSGAPTQGPAAPNATQGQATPPLKPGVDRLARAIDIIKRRYITEPDTAKLVDDAIRGMLTKIDRDAHYFNPEELRVLRAAKRGPADLGVHVVREQATRASLGGLRVVTAEDGSPAAAAGLRAGDIVTHIDDAPVTPRISLTEARTLLYGQAETSVRLAVQRSGTSGPIYFLLTRAPRAGAIDVQTLPSGIVVARVSTLTGGMGKRLVDGIARARVAAGNGFSGLILDLRDTSGGALDQAVAVADAFLEDGPIVLTRVRSADRPIPQAATAGDIAAGYPIVVLANAGTAGMAEVVAGALKDRKRATVVGVRSFGRASQQSLLPIGPRGASGGILMTTTRYETPGGRSIDGNGIVPDVAVAAATTSSPCRSVDRAAADGDGVCVRLPPDTDPDVARAVAIVTSKRAEAGGAPAIRQ